MKFYPAKSYGSMSPGDMLRAVRELQELSQAQLARASGIAKSTLSAIEQGRISLGVERAKKLARVLQVHPGVLLFPDWNVQERPQKSRVTGYEAHSFPR